MTVKVKFFGGPRDGKVNNLSNYDEPPAKIAVKVKETKAVNMQPGYYELVDADASIPNYIWRQEG